MSSFFCIYPCIYFTFQTLFYRAFLSGLRLFVQIAALLNCLRCVHPPHLFYHRPHVLRLDFGDPIDVRAMPLTIRPMPETGKRAKSIVISAVDCCSSGLRELTVARPRLPVPFLPHCANCANKTTNFSGGLGEEDSPKGCFQKQSKKFIT